MLELTGLTPKIITEKLSNTRYQIPIYQRLFEWDRDKIEQLLDDLYISYDKNKDEPYYVGMLTSTGKKNDLVDGQQRFTVMTLFGIIMQEEYAPWGNFLKVEENNTIKTRLYFTAREDDQTYLECIVLKSKNDTEVIPNEKMKQGQSFIKEWLNEKCSDNKRGFCQFVYEKLMFFISELPETYEGKDLNKYFESMNSTGRNLESHEILKIECLKKLGSNNELSEANATKIWNAVAQMDKPLLRKSTENGKKEKDSKLHEKYEKVLQSIYTEKVILNNFDFSVLNDCQAENNNGKTIREIEPFPKKPERHIRTSSYHGMLTFGEFLLQVLYIQIYDSDCNRIVNISVNEFFDVQKLLETFKKETVGWTSENWKIFYCNLLKYRILFDYYVILIPNEEDGPFDLEYSDSVNEEEEEEKKDKQKLKQYQAMLYAGSASKSFYIWLNPYLRKLNELYTSHNFADRSCQSLTIFLKTEDNKIHAQPSLNKLTYQAAPLYWFRRLDYYLWEQNLEKQGSEFDNLINKFRFRRGGRSIEHFHPQNQTNQSEQWGKGDIDSFGNLCLVSSSFNFRQSNDSLGVKIARVRDQIDRNQIESLKLYEIYKSFTSNGGNWTVDLMKQHEAVMYAILENSFENLK